MASVIDICNAAIAHYGGAAQVTAIDPPDGSAEAGRCARFFPFSRREMLDMGPWTFAKKRVQLTPVANPSTIWAYAYAMPSDCMNAKRILQQPLILSNPLFWPYTQALTVDQLTFFDERGSADFQIEGATLLTNEPDAVLLYTVDILDPARFPATFCTALSYLLASYLVGPVIKGRAGAQAAAQYRQIATAMARGALAMNANNSAEQAEYYPESLRVRG